MKYLFLVLSIVGVLCGIGTMVSAFVPSFNEGRLALGLLYTIFHSIALAVTIALIKSE